MLSNRINNNKILTWQPSESGFEIFLLVGWWVVELSRAELSWAELGWVEWSGVEWSWAELSWAELFLPVSRNWTDDFRNIYSSFYTTFLTKIFRQNLFDPSQNFVTFPTCVTLSLPPPILSVKIFRQKFRHFAYWLKSLIRVQNFVTFPTLCNSLPPPLPPLSASNSTFCSKNFCQKYCKISLLFLFAYWLKSLIQVKNFVTFPIGLLVKIFDPSKKFCHFSYAV